MNFMCCFQVLLGTVCLYVQEEILISCLFLYAYIQISQKFDYYEHLSSSLFYLYAYLHYVPYFGLMFKDKRKCNL